MVSKGNYMESHERSDHECTLYSVMNCPNEADRVCSQKMSFSEEFEVVLIILDMFSGMKRCF